MQYQNHLNSLLCVFVNFGIEAELQKKSPKTARAPPVPKILHRNFQTSKPKLPYHQNKPLPLPPPPQPPLKPPYTSSLPNLSIIQATMVKLPNATPPMPSSSTATNQRAQTTALKSIKSLAPLLDRILVQRIKAETKTAGGIFLPESSVKELNEAKVLAVGPGGLDKEGRRVAPSVAPGDKVLIPQVCWCFDGGRGGGVGRGVDEEVEKGRWRMKRERCANRCGHGSMAGAP